MSIFILTIKLKNLKIVAKYTQHKIYYLNHFSLLTHSSVVLNTSTWSCDNFQNPFPFAILNILALKIFFLLF